MIKFKTIISIIIIAVVLIACGYTAHERFSSYDDEVVSWEQVTVRTGETVWAICDRNNYSNNYDIRKIVDMVNEYNHIDGYIHPGDKIYIPIFECET